MPSCMLMNPLLYVESVVEALKPFDTFLIESELVDILQTLTEAKYNMFFNKAENYQKLQQAVKRKRFLKYHSHHYPSQRKEEHKQLHFQ